MTLPRDASEGGPVLLRPDAAAKMLAMSRSKMYEALASGTIASVRLGRVRRVAIAEVHRIAAEGLPLIPPRTRGRQSM